MFVAFDFDQTLTRLCVQKYAEELINRGLSVYVLTYRYHMTHFHNYGDLYPESEGHNDLWPIIDKIGIPRENVIFTNCQPKSKWLEYSRVIWLLDDDVRVMEDLKRNKNCKTIPIQSKGNFKSKCERLLKIST